MLNAIIRFALRQRMIVLALALLITGYGSYVALHTPIDVLPDLNRPRREFPELLLAPSQSRLRLLSFRDVDRTSLKIEWFEVGSKYCACINGNPKNAPVRSVYFGFKVRHETLIQEGLFQLGSPVWIQI